MERQVIPYRVVRSADVPRTRTVGEACRRQTGPKMAAAHPVPQDVTVTRGRGQPEAAGDERSAKNHRAPVWTEALNLPDFHIDQWLAGDEGRQKYHKIL